MDKETNLRLIQILPSLVSGGVERGCIDVARHCAQQGGTSVIVSNGGPLVETLKGQGITHIKLPVHSKNPLTIRLNIKRLKKIFRKISPHIVHVRSRAPAWSAIPACRVSNVPVVTTFHGIYGAKGVWKRRYNSIMLKSDATIVASRYVRSHITDTYGARYAKHLTLIPRGVDPAEFKDNPVYTEEYLQSLRLKHQVIPGQKTILLPGRLSRWKGQHVLIHALAKMRQKTGWVALVVGDNEKEADYAEELKLLAKREGIADRMRWIKHTQDIAAFYRIADTTVSASIEPEAFGRTIIEAQLSGSPVIATAHGGALDTVIHGKTGLLIPPNDSDALCEALNYMIFMPDNERERLINASCSHAEQHFSLDAMLNNTFDLYENILQSR